MKPQWDRGIPAAHFKCPIFSAVRVVVIILTVLIAPMSVRGQQVTDTVSPAQLRSDPRVGWLRAHLTPIRTLDPRDDGFRDLEPIGRAIGDARIVLLGEGSHNDGPVISARSRLVKYLHKQLGFDVLVWESGFYDVAKSWELIEAGENAPRALERSIFNIWRVAETDELFDYIEKAARGPRPLIQAGMDTQLTGTASRDLLPDDLREFLARLGIDTRLLDDGAPFRRALSAMSSTAPDSGVYGGSGYARPDSVFVDSLVTLRARLMAARSAAAVDARALAFWERMLENIEIEARILRGEAAEHAAGVRRDHEMGRNVVWLAQKRFPNRKIIVWAATIHVMARVPEPLPPEARCEGSSCLALGGKVVRSTFGPKVYHLGFTHYEGAIGPPRSTRPTQVPQSQACRTFLVRRMTLDDANRCTRDPHLEDLLNAAGYENAFLDLRTRPKGGEWLDSPLHARPLALTFWRDVWPDIFDGLFFIKIAKPTTLSDRGLTAR